MIAMICRSLLFLLCAALLTVQGASVAYAGYAGYDAEYDTDDDTGYDTRYDARYGTRDPAAREAEVMLRDLGLPCAVLATSYDDDDESWASISLVQRIEDGSFWIACVEGDTVFGTPLTDKIYYALSRRNDWDDAPVIFRGCFFNDTRGTPDDTLGKWDGRDHYLPVCYPLGAEDDPDGADYISSARRTLRAQHYDARIAWKPHISVIRYLFRALPDLQAAVAQRDIDIEDLL